MSVAFKNVLFSKPQAFCNFREERRRLLIGDNFLQQATSGVSRICREKVAAARTEKLGTHTHSLTHTHTHKKDDYYTLTANAYARVIIIINNQNYQNVTFMHAYSNSLQYHTVKPQTSLICNLNFLNSIIQSKALQTKHVHKIQLF